MKSLLLFSIRLYWKLVPVENRGRCIFKESCSHYVYRTALEEGALKAIKALSWRWHACRPGYHILRNKEHNFTGLILHNGEVLPKEKVAESISSLFE